MSYVGIRTQNQEVLAQFRRRMEDCGANVQTVQHGQSHIGVAFQNTTSLQVGFDNGMLCTVDGRILSGENFGKSKGREAPQNDAITVIRKWMRHGTSALREMEMTASIALSDARPDRLVLARAQNGVPPIFFARKREALLWSNSIKTLLRCGVDAELDLRALDSYFALGYIPSPWTLLKEIRKVPAGQYLDCKKGDQVFKKHWEPVQQSRSPRNLNEAADTLKEKLCRSLEEMVEGYDRVGVLLSSGVDSSLLVGLLHCELGVPVEAFTFQYSGYEGKYNEYDRARLLSSQYDIPHHKIEYSGEWLRSNISKIIRQYEEPLTYGHHTARLYEVSEREIPLLISGVTGEMFISRTSTYALIFNNRVLQEIAKITDILFDTWPLRRLSRINHFIDIISSTPEEIFYNEVHTNSLISDGVRQCLYRDKSLHNEGRKSIIRLFRNISKKSGLSQKSDQLSHLKNAFLVPDHILWWNYRWARAHELQIGAPYLSPRVRSWMESLKQPLWPPYKESLPKVLIRRVAASVMPKEIAYYQKVAQTAPFWLWFQDSLRPILHEYLQPSKLREDGIFDVEFVQRVVQEHTSGKGSNPYLLWTLLCFMVWKEEFLNRPHTLQ